MPKYPESTNSALGSDFSQESDHAMPSKAYQQMQLSAARLVTFRDLKVHDWQMKNLKNGGTKILKFLEKNLPKFNTQIT